MVQLAESIRGRRRVPLSHGLRVRAIEPTQVRTLAGSAPGEDTEHRRALRSWLDANETTIEHAFAIELRERPSRSDAVVCFLLLLNAQNRCGFARIELGKTDLGKLRRCRRDEQHLIALNLAARGTLLSGPDTAPA